MTVEAVLNHVDHFQRRVVQEAVADATAAYWTRRAETFEWARPRPTDYIGRATPDQIKALDQRCRDRAEACRARASTSLLPGDDLGAVA